MNITSAMTMPGVLQAYSCGLRYQFLDNKLTGIHSPVFCRDYLQLVVWSEITGRSTNHLGFYYCGGPMQLPKKRFKMGLDYIMANKNIAFRPEQMNMMKLILHYFEDSMGIERSSFKLKNNNDFILVESSTRWIQRPYLTSLYTLLLRYALKYDGETMDEFILNPRGLYADSHYFRKASAVIKLILAGEEINQTYDDYVSEESVYRDSGIMGTLNKIKNYENISA